MGGGGGDHRKAISCRGQCNPLGVHRGRTCLMKNGSVPNATNRAAHREAEARYNFRKCCKEGTHDHERERQDPARQRQRLHARRGERAALVRRGEDRRLAGARRLVLVRSRDRRGQHRALHGRGPGAARARRPAARQRRARPGRVLRSDGDRRGHARRLLQPRHEAAARGRRRHHHRDGRRDAARPGVRVRERPPVARVRRVAERELRRHQGRRRDDDDNRAGCATSSSTRRRRSSTRASTTRPATPPART